jgi:two-component system NtrC family response regulator
LLDFHGGNRQQTAYSLGISRKTLYRKLQQYAID